jgi:hypothetical protein
LSTGMQNRITDQHRLFYVNGELEFALFYDPKIVDKSTIINSFLESRDWKWYMQVYDLKKVEKATISKDLKRVDIAAK